MEQEPAGALQRTRDLLKREHEKAIGDQLLEAVGIRAAFERLGDDKEEPDLLYKLKDKTLGIEVGTAYYEDSDAKQAWTLAAGEREFPKEGYEFRAGGVLVNPDNMICKRVQGELDDKCQKSYVGADEVWLCVALEAPLSDANSVKECVAKLKVPDSHKFGAIYIAYYAPLHEGSGFTVVKIS